jgi:hypothetical protein
MQRIFVGGLFLILEILFVVSSFAQPGAPSRTEKDACSFLTAADAQHIAGMAMKNTLPSGPEWKNLSRSKGLCHYEQTEPKSDPKVEIYLHMMKIADDDKSVGDMMWNSAKGGAKAGGKVESVTGIGDEAFLVHYSNGTVIAIGVRKRASNFILTVHMFKNDPVAAMKDVARKIADQF